MSVDLDALAAVGDPPADAVVARLASEGNVWAANALLRDVAANRDPIPATVPPVLARFLAETDAVPAFADPEKMHRAQQLFERHMFVIVTSLFCGSLPRMYASEPGARLLRATGRLEADIDRRINETGRFVFDVLSPGGFGPSGRAIRSLQKVRLLHACVRFHVRQRAPSERMPINQEELLGTLFGFSLVVLDSMRRLGVEVSPREENDFYQAWRAAGPLLGIEPAHLPEDARAARALATRIAARNDAAGDAGRELTATLVEAMERHMPAGLRAAPQRLMIHLLGDRIAAALGLAARPEPASLLSVPGGSAALGWLARRTPSLLERLGPAVGRAILEGLMSVKLEGERPTFPMPARGLPATR